MSSSTKKNGRTPAESFEDGEVLSSTKRNKNQAIRLLQNLEKKYFPRMDYSKLNTLYISEILQFDKSVHFYEVFNTLANFDCIFPNNEKNQPLVAFNVPNIKRLFEKSSVSNSTKYPVGIKSENVSFSTGNMSSSTKKNGRTPAESFEDGEVLSSTKRKTNQAIRLLQALDHRNISRIKFIKLRNIYDSEILKFDESVKFFEVFHLLRTRDCITCENIQNPCWVVNVPIMKRLLQTSSVSNSPIKHSIGRDQTRETTRKKVEVHTVSASTKKSESRTSNGSVSESNNDSKKHSKKGIICLDQRYGFKLCDIPNAQPENASQTKPFCCTLCSKNYGDSNALRQHKNSDKHLFIEAYHNCRQEVLLEGKKPPFALSGEKNDILVTSAKGNEGNSTLCIDLLLEDGKMITKDIQLHITYNPSNKNVKPLFLDNTFLMLFNNNLSAQLLDENTRKTVRKEKKIKKNIMIKQNEVGTYDCIVVFKFLRELKPSKFDAPFFVMKQICVRVDNLATVENGQPIHSLPSVKKDASGLSKGAFVSYIPSVVEAAEPLPNPKEELKLIVPLKFYDLPQSYNRFFNSGFENSANITPHMLQEKQNILQMLVDGLNEDNYDRYFSLLLYLEEHQTLCDLKVYSLKNAPLTQHNKHIVLLEVPGLAEDRPSVLKGDGIFFTLKEGERYSTYKGWVQRVCHTTLHVSMGKRFMAKFINNMKVTVHFSFNRLSLRMEHRALEELKKGGQVTMICFPHEHGRYALDKPITRWFNTLVKENKQQAQAVQSIINGTSLPSPYLIFGPPGTGKTVTLVETMKQIFFESESTYILATAPSNSAADLLAERLLTSIPVSMLIRLYSPSRDWSSVPEQLHKCSNFNNRECYFPSLQVLKKYRIIVATLICAGRLFGGGCPAGHFTHIFVDECGHGMEPTALVPIAGLLGLKPYPGQLVLSGDPCQLGPIIRSPVAKQLGLSESLLERLMISCDLYKKQQDGNYNPKVLTKLVKNFRSHPHILKVSNELFYDGELVPCGENSSTHLACKWDGLPKQDVPLIFHGVIGKDEQDAGSPSFYNIAEVNVVVNYVRKILDSKFCGKRLKPTDIGIISPYRRQIDKLHRALERSQLRGCSVGSVEQFQGQERTVIIVSTVRSNPAKLALDQKFRLGFLKESKRFNVAITRAKSLLIVVGNPHILQHDPNWRCLLKWVIQLGGYTHTKCPFQLSRCDDTLQPVDLDNLRVPLKKKFEKNLALTKQAIDKDTQEWNEKFDKETNKWNANYKTIIDKIKSLSFLSEFEGVSDLEKEVSPPFNNFEQ